MVLRNRPDIVAGWSDEEVARRWWRVCPQRRNPDQSVPEPKPCELGLLMQKVDEYRQRLSDISWLMRLACQPIARRANQEDEVDGRFFAKRFDCRRLNSEAELLTCSLYVDLNVIHAGQAETPEESEFTSACDRIRARWQSVQTELQTPVSLEATADAWLAPVFLDEQSASAATSEQDTAQQQGAQQQVTAQQGAAQQATLQQEATAQHQSAAQHQGAAQQQSTARPACNPIGSARLSDKGFLPLTLEQYLTLLDTIGRMVRRGQRGQIPAELPPILTRLNLQPQAWLDWLLELFQQPPDPARPPSFASSG